MRQSLAVLAGKTALALSRLRGGGSAFPGLVALKIAPQLLTRAFSAISGGVVFVLGSNGKSTTTHMVSEILRAHGLNVFTNPTGANLPQGVASSLLAHVGLRGVIRADIAVLEVDEAFAVELAQTLRPRIILGLNTQIDQLYRFIDTDRAGHMMLDAMALATEHIVSNRDDPFLRTIDKEVSAAERPHISYFGVDPSVVAASPSGLLNAENFADADDAVTRHAEVEVVAHGGDGATFRMGDELLSLRLPARGLHYAVDAAAALATSSLALGSRWRSSSAISCFAAMRPAYGRGEILPFASTEVTMVMFKNLASLQLNLDSLDDTSGPIMVAIDEGTPDMSWIYDAEFRGVRAVDVVSGDKAWQMALCMKMRGVEVRLVEPDVKKAIAHMRALAQPGVGQTWLVNYEVTMIARTLIGFGELETQS